MRSYKYCEWKYKMEYQTNKLGASFRRLERYNTRHEILSYDEGKASIKLAMDSFIKNKMFRSIEQVFKINDAALMAIMGDW